MDIISVAVSVDRELFRLDESPFHEFDDPMYFCIKCVYMDYVMCYVLCVLRVMCVMCYFFGVRCVSCVFWMVFGWFFCIHGFKVGSLCFDGLGLRYISKNRLISVIHLCFCLLYIRRLLPI